MADRGVFPKRMATTPSMTRIDFYTGAADRQLVACQIAAKALGRGQRVLIYTDSPLASDEIDHKLWSFQQLSFLPHCRVNDPLAGETPIVIDHLGKNLPHAEILINLHSECPPFFAEFERVIEIVGYERQETDQARQRFRHYRASGYPPETIALGQARNN